MDKPTLQNNHGMTLTELIIAASLVGIVMVGAVSIDYAIRSTRQSVTASSTLSLQTAADLLQITRDANATTGMGDSDDTMRGLYTYATGPWREICFRQDQSDTQSLVDDLWVCYMHGADYLLWRCFNIPLSEPMVFTNCVGQGTETQMVQLDGNYYTTEGIDFFTLVDGDSDGRTDAIDITLAATLDPLNPSNPLTNPTNVVSTRINPPSLGR